MNKNYEIAYKFLKEKADKNAMFEMEFPEDERVNFYVAGDGESSIETIVLDLGFFESEFIHESEKELEFFRSLSAIEVFPEITDEIHEDEELLHISVKTK